MERSATAEDSGRVGDGIGIRCASGKCGHGRMDQRTKEYPVDVVLFGGDSLVFAV
jgi:hypothetical protein